MTAPTQDTKPFDEALADITNVVGGGSIRSGAAIADLDPGEHPENLHASAVVSPASTAEVAAIVQICARHRIPIVPQGGRTGLVGGGISKNGELALSLQKMNHIEQIDPIECVAIAQAGATLQSLQEAAMEHRLDPGIDLASRGSATLGGMVSTNAGGVMAFRNGVMRHRVLGLEAVLPDGSIYSDLTRVVKNSAGYDLKHLFIGAEGTLGVVTKIVVKLDPVPRVTATAMFGLPSTRAALELVSLARATGKLRAAEVLWSDYFKFTAAHFKWSPPDYNAESLAHLIVDLGGDDEGDLNEALVALFETIAESHAGTTAVLATSAGQEQEIWRLREETGLIYRDYPAAPSYDISVPLGQTELFLERALPALSAVEAGLSPFVFGHFADGNLHIVLNRSGDWLTGERRDAVEAILYADLREMGGSFSAEHGVGSKRILALRATSDPTKLILMAAIKKALDPENLFNPGKLFERL